MTPRCPEPVSIRRGLVGKGFQKHPVEFVKRFRDCEIRRQVEVGFAQAIDAGEHDLGDERGTDVPEDTRLDTVLDDPAQAFDAQSDVFLPDQSGGFPTVYVDDRGCAEPFRGDHANLKIFEHLTLGTHLAVGCTSGFVPDSPEEAIENVQHEFVLARGEFIQCALGTTEVRGDVRDVELGETLDKNEFFERFENLFATVADRSAGRIVGQRRGHDPKAVDGKIIAMILDRIAAALGL